MASLQEHSSSATANGGLRKLPNHRVAETELSYKVGDSVGGGESIWDEDGGAEKRKMSNGGQGMTRHVIRSAEFQDFATGNRYWEADDGSVMRGDSDRRRTSQRRKSKATVN
jgi:hypothetical protein